MSTDPGAPQRCKLFDDKRDVFLGWRQLAGEGATYPRLRPKPFNPSVVMRQMAPKPEGKTVLAALLLCRAQKRCNDTALLESVMQEFYPRIEYYVCHSDGSVESPAPEEFAVESPNGNNGMGLPMPRGGLVGSRLSGM